jgi:hypothetical protein
MDFKLIERYFKDRKGDLNYLGLPSVNMVDLIQWESYFNHFSAVERGKNENGFVEQHNLMLTAFQNNLASRMDLIRGDIDEILIIGHDIFGNTLKFPYDVISLDYSGGLIYKDRLGYSQRIDAIGKLIEEQAYRNKDFLLFISCNMDSEDKGEIRRLFSDINRELCKIGIDATATIQAYLDHGLDEVRLKVYVPFVIQNLSEKSYQMEMLKPIFYSGNKATRMAHFSFWMKRTITYVAGKPKQSSLIHIINTSAYMCINGNLQEEDFNIPKIEN